MSSSNNSYINLYRFITPNSIKLAQLSKKDDGWLVEKLAYRRLDRIEDVKSSAAKISEEIEIAFKSGKFSTTNAAVSLPVSSLSLIHI